MDIHPVAFLTLLALDGEWQLVTSIDTDRALDVQLRLQSLIAGWRGAERGASLADLHTQVAAAVSPGDHELVPARLILVPHLDASRLVEELRRVRWREPSGAVEFRRKLAGGFDAALVPVGDRWLLAVGAELPLPDQVALYGHAVGHLLLNREACRLGQLPLLDPRDGYAHADTVAELRQLDLTPQPVDRRVLETYPTLAQLLGPQSELPAASGTELSELRSRLVQSGWPRRLLELPYVLTPGRVYVTGSTVRRGPGLKVDALLRVEASVPIAAVQLLRADEDAAEAERRLVELARARLHVPFAYLVGPGETVREYDCRCPEPRVTLIQDVPPPAELEQRWLSGLGLEDAQARRTIEYPYGSGAHPRYYQEAAINHAVVAALQAKRRLCSPRILITLATGTGKTKVAFQLVWKLKRTGAFRKVLFLTDRDYLLSQAMDNEFGPLSDARWRIRGVANTARDVIFATYQAIAQSEVRRGLFRDYPRDFFDLVIVDECHRGSAQDESNWREILEYFSGAIQVGLTATPKQDENIQTYSYFGNPIVEYSLRDGITDGFLAPYRVRRVLLGAEVADVPGATAEDLDERTLREQTDVIAHHLAEYLRETDPMAKTIVFCVDQAHADLMRFALERELSELVERHPDYVERIVAEEGLEGRRALGRFATPDEPTPVVVTTSRLLSTGVDVPTCKNIVLARPVGSMVEFKQIIGRGTRLHEPDKAWFTILDYSGATKLFFDPGFDGYPEVVDVEVVQPVEYTPDPDTAAEVTVDEPHGEYEPGLPPPESEPVTEDALGATGCVEPVGPVVDVVPGVAIDERVEPVPAGQQPTTERVEQPAEPEVEPAPPEEVVRHGDRHVLSVRGEVVYDLGPDGKTLRALSYRDYTRAALRGVAESPTELRARWLHPEQREELLERLYAEGVDIPTLAEALHQPEADPLDLLLHAAFGLPAHTRSEYARRLRQEHPEFFERYEPTARRILDAILDKYVSGETEEVGNTNLLKVPPLSEEGTFVELASRFGGGKKVREALGEMQQLLYSA